jgi:hypothetical protein
MLSTAQISPPENRHDACLMRHAAAESFDRMLAERMRTDG